MFNVGRNNPRVRGGARRGARARHAGHAAARRLAAAAAARRGAAAAGAARRLGRVLFTSTGTEAVEAAIKLGRAATGRARVVSVEHGFHGLTLGALSASTATRRSRSASGRSCPASRACRSATSSARGRARTRGRRALHRRAGRRQGRHPAAGRVPRGRAGALPPVRDALLPRRGADRLRAHRPAVRARALGPRARHPRAVAKSLSGGYVPVGALLLGDAVLRRRLRLARARVQPRLDVRAERPRDGGRARDAARAGRRSGSSSVRRGSASCCSSARGRSSSGTTSSRTSAGSG